MIDVKDQIEEFEKQHKNFAISYGGDGTLLEVARKNDFKKALFPIRNYGLCEKHQNVFDDLLTGISKINFKQTLHPLIQFDSYDLHSNALAEITMRNSDPTSCVRFDVFVNGKEYMNNVICDGVIFSTSLGSHGYFKSVARTIFSTPSIGIGFICPTYGINNLIVNLYDKIDIKFRRNTSIVITADKMTFGRPVEEGSLFTVSRDSSMNQAIFGYDIFCCPECRKNRNSTIVNDQYLG